MDAALDYLLEEGRKEGMKEGRKEGRKEGMKEGRKEGSDRVNRLGILLTAAGRSGDFLKSLEDQTLQQQLFIEFGLDDE